MYKITVHVFVCICEILSLPFCSFTLRVFKTWRYSFNLEIEEVTGECILRFLKITFLNYVLFFFSVAQQTNSVIDRFIVELSRSHPIRHMYTCTHASVHHRTPLNE